MTVALFHKKCSYKKPPTYPTQYTSVCLFVRKQSHLLEQKTLFWTLRDFSLEHQIYLICLFKFSKLDLHSKLWYSGIWLQLILQFMFWSIESRNFNRIKGSKKTLVKSMINVLNFLSNDKWFFHWNGTSKNSFITQRMHKTVPRQRHARLQLPNAIHLCNLNTVYYLHSITFISGAWCFFIELRRDPLIIAFLLETDPSHPIEISKRYDRIILMKISLMIRLIDQNKI